MVSFKLVTVVCEPVLNVQIVAVAKASGATGFTITEVRGEGSGEKSSGEIPDLKVKIEIIVEAEAAKKLMRKMADLFFENYSLITYSSDIDVLRANKFEK